MSKTLYVSDLDGTLMNKNQTISSFTANTINDLVKAGMLFSFATARSMVTASKITANIIVDIPIVVYNGAYILENKTKKVLLSNIFNNDDSLKILEKLQLSEIYPIVYSNIDGAERFSYCKDNINVQMQGFLDSRKGDVRDNPVSLFSDLKKGSIFYFSCIGDEKKLFPLYNEFKSSFYCVYQKDIYTKDQWLEILPKQATKANAILQLKKMLSCDKIISFGDGINDIPMFSISDECYAVENADDELKKISTGIILSNDEDGVAKWLNNNVPL